MQMSNLVMLPPYQYVHDKSHNPSCEKNSRGYHFPINHALPPIFAVLLIHHQKGRHLPIPSPMVLVLDCLNENVNRNHLLGNAVDQCRCVLFDQNALLDQTSEGTALSVALGGGVEVVEGEGDAILP